MGNLQALIGLFVQTACRYKSGHASPFPWPPDGKCSQFLCSQGPALCWWSSDQAQFTSPSHDFRANIYSQGVQRKARKEGEEEFILILLLQALFQHGLGKIRITVHMLLSLAQSSLK